MTSRFAPRSAPLHRFSPTPAHRSAPPDFRVAPLTLRLHALVSLIVHVKNLQFTTYQNYLSYIDLTIFGRFKMLNMITLSTLPVPESDLSMILKVIEKL